MNQAQLATFAGLAIVVTSALWLRPLVGEVPSPSTDRSQRAPPHGAHCSIDVGTLECGGCAEVRFKFTNDFDSAIDTANVQTSCPCLKVEFDKGRIAPQETGEATIRLDLADETKFTGALSPEIRFFDDQGGQRFVLVVNAIVASSDRRALQQ